MRTPLLMILYLLTGLPVLAQNEDRRYEAERLRHQQNHIEQRLTYQYKLATGDSVLTERQFYDSQGRLVKRENYDRTGHLQYQGVLTYDSTNGCLRREIGYDGTGQLVQQFIYECDKDGHSTDYQQLGEDQKVLTHQQSVYNKKGQQIKKYSYLKTTDGRYLSSAFTYDKAGRSQRWITYGMNGEVGGITEYDYDERGNLTAAYQVAGSQKTLRYSQQYNEKNQLITTQHYLQNAYFADGRPLTQPVDRRQQFSYDGAGNLVEETTWSKDKLVNRIRYYFVKK